MSGGTTKTFSVLTTIQAVVNFAVVFYTLRIYSTKPVANSACLAFTIQTSLAVSWCGTAVFNDTLSMVERRLESPRTL